LRRPFDLGDDFDFILGISVPTGIFIPILTSENYVIVIIDLFFIILTIQLNVLITTSKYFPFF